MKKILALTLAAVMAAGMTTVAFAKDDEIGALEFTGYVWYDADGDGTIESTESAYIARGSADSSVDTLGTGIIAGGKDLYFELKAYYENDMGTMGAQTKVAKLSDVKSWEVATDWTVEEDKVEEPKFVQAKVDGSYGVYLKLTLPENDTVDNKDLVGTIGLGDTRSDAKSASGNALANVVVTYGRDRTNDNTYSDRVEIKSFEGSFPEAYETKGAVVDFDDVDDIIDIEFNDLAMFTVNVTGQGKLDLRFNTDFDREFADKYDYANIDFLTFSGNPTFNKTGDFYLYAPEDAFIYKKGAEGVEEINGLEWSDEYDAWHFRTRELSAYVISDVELDEQTVTDTDDSSSTTEDGNKQNPDTGR